MESVLKLRIRRYCPKDADPAVRGIYTSGFKIKYITRQEAVLKHFRQPDFSEEDFVLSLQRSRLKQPQNEGLIHFDLNSRKTTFPSVNEVVQRFQEIDPEQVIWDGEISLSNQNANLFRFGSQADFIEVVQRFMPSFLKNQGFDLTNVDFYGAVHVNTDHPHMHWMFIEKEPNIYNPKTKQYEFRKKGKLNLVQIQQFDWIASKFIENRKAYYEQYELKSTFWSIRNDVRTDLKKYEFKRINKIIQPVVEEAKTMKTKVFNKLSDESKAAIWTYFENEKQFLPSDVLKKYQNYQNFLNQHSRNEHFQEENEKFQSWLGNKILKDVIHADYEANLPPLYLRLRWMQNQDNKYLPPINETTRSNNIHQFEMHLNKYDYKRKYEHLKRYYSIQKQIRIEKMKANNNGSN